LTLRRTSLSFWDSTGPSSSPLVFWDKSHPSDPSVANLQFLLTRNGYELVKASKSRSWKLRLDVNMLEGDLTGEAIVGIYVYLERIITNF
jgi:hypothetical protein